MGREIKRVPAFFDWPVGEVWWGFYLPKRLHAQTCVVCDGSGYNAETRQIADDFYDHAGLGNRWAYDYGTAPDGSVASRPPWRIVGETRKWCSSITEDEVAALIEDGRLMDLTHTFVPGKGWQRREDGHVPTAAEVNHWSEHGMGHDTINRMILIRARATRMGVYGECLACRGEGQVYPDDATKVAAEAWKPTPVPTGEWWQVWETVSEGSPVTPAFASATDLVNHLVANGDAWDQKRGDGGWSRASAEKFVRSGWAPSLISTSTADGGLVVAPRDHDVLAGN